MKKVLLINDMAGYGRISYGVMSMVLASKGFHVSSLPTALVSNTLDYGEFEILSTENFMKNTIDVWDKLGFSFDAVATGITISDSQAKLVSDYCKKLKGKGVKIFCDPVMGDDGILYPGIGEKTVEYLREIVSVADYIVPNYSEAVFLAGEQWNGEETDHAGACRLCEKLQAIGAENVIITSAKVDGKDCTLLKEGKNDMQILTFDKVPVRFVGTGDLFCALFMAGVLAGDGARRALRKAMDKVRELIIKDIENPDKYAGVRIERYFEEL